MSRVDVCVENSELSVLLMKVLPVMRAAEIKSG